MNKLASYAFHSSRDSITEAEDLFNSVNGLVADWLGRKGSIVGTGSVKQLTMQDQRIAALLDTSTNATNGSVRSYILKEPTVAGHFETAIQVGRLENQLAVSVHLRAGGEENQIHPIQYVVRCPQIVRDVIGTAGKWFIGEVPLTTVPMDLYGTQGGKNLVDILWHFDRNIPILVVSKYEGLLLTKDFADKAAADLCGLCVVAAIDEDAAWAITHSKGKEWSCFNGAIRLYWPFKRTSSEPFAHPLWTLQKLRSNAGTDIEASSRIREQIRKKILGISSFAVSEPKLILTVRRNAFQEERERQRQKNSERIDWEEIATSYASENEQLNEQIQYQSEQIEELQDQVQNLNIALRFQPGNEVLQPEEDTPPTTVQEAVVLAQKYSGDELVFGGNVDEGIHSLAENAGPPEKILQYLLALRDLHRELRKGPIGMSVTQWLRNRGIVVSAESETVRKSAEELSKRKWNDGTSSRVFDMHLKPSDGTSPDRCVRIYFDCQEHNEKIVVGWVGRHP